jgi:hypothetical protein
MEDCLSKYLMKRIRFEILGRAPMAESDNKEEKISIPRAIEKIDLIVNEWKAAFERVKAAPRWSMELAIDNLRWIRKSTFEIVVPDELTAAHQHLIDSMDYFIAGFEAYQDYQDMDQVNQMFSKGNEAFEHFMEKVLPFKIIP